jgi:integrase
VKPLPETTFILDGRATLFKRSRTSMWQVRFKIQGKYRQFSTGTDSLKQAKEVAFELALDSWLKERNNIPLVIRNFKYVANLTIQELQQLLDSNKGKVTYKDYIWALQKYMIPFLGKYTFDQINQDLIRQFEEWRIFKMRRKPSGSHLNTHNAAMNRVFNKAVDLGYIAREQLPQLGNRGVKTGRRPDFTYDEFVQLVKFMCKWVKKSRAGQTKVVRKLLFNYVMILVSTGIRAGTEAMNLKWKHVRYFMVEGEQFLSFNVSGKTKHRELTVGYRAVRYLKRIHQDNPAIAHLSFDELIEKGSEEYLFRLDGRDKTTDFGRVFKGALEASNLLIDKRTDTKRSLYSLRHVYATMTLTNTNISTYLLAKHMGTSQQMIERHYGHVDMRKKASEISKFGGI